MKNKAFLITSIFCIFIVVISSTNSFLLQISKSKQVEDIEKLTCEISIPTKVRVLKGWINAKLIIKNVSNEPIKVCALYSGAPQIWRGHYEETFRPDFWRSDRPRPTKFVEKIMSLAPDEEFIIPLRINYENHLEFFRGHPLTITAGYSIGNEFAEQYRTWTGRIQAKPVTIDVIE